VRSQVWELGKGEERDIGERVNPRRKEEDRREGKRWQRKRKGGCKP
jgi:hypothetical protein